MKKVLSHIYVPRLALVMSLGCCAAVSAMAQGSQYNPPVTKTSKGIIITGWRPNVRAFSAFSGSAAKGARYGQVVSRYKQEVGEAINVFCMVVPTAVTFYCPSEPKDLSKSELEAIDSIRANLSADVRFIDAYQALLPHVGEKIYSRTDHHWSPLGAYYAARELAEVAEVPFLDLAHFDTITIHDYVGSMFTFSQSVSLKQSPEEFVYYKPRDVEYSVSATKYVLVDNRISKSSYLENAPFFYKFKDGHPSSYCTFMGGDTNNTKVVTSTHNGRRLLMMKDSFGNAIPAYLFSSFEEICIVDCRYFDGSVRQYVADNRITDIVFVNNVVHACKTETSDSYLAYLTQ